MMHRQDCPVCGNRPRVFIDRQKDESLRRHEETIRELREIGKHLDAEIARLQGLNQQNTARIKDFESRPTGELPYVGQPLLLKGDDGNWFSARVDAPLTMYATDGVHSYNLRLDQRGVEWLPTLREGTTVWSVYCLGSGREIDQSVKAGPLPTKIRKISGNTFFTDAFSTPRYLDDYGKTWWLEDPDREE